MKKVISLISLCALSVIIYSSLFAQKTPTTGINVSTSVGGTLFLEDKEITNLWDNDTYTIPIEKPGTYTVKMKFADGREISKTVVISSRGLVEVGFRMPPKNIIMGGGMNSLVISWDNAGAGASYNVYYNTENHLESAKVQKDIKTTSTTLGSLEWNKTYYVWVSVVENYMESTKSGVISKTLLNLKEKIGQTGPGGGIIFYDKGDKTGGWQYLEAAPAQTEFQNVQWGAARQKCADLSFGGFNDWFLPNKDQLNLMYECLKKQGLGGFSNDRYWSSSEYDSNYAWVQSFSNGSQGYGYSKTDTNRARAVRAF